MLLARVDTQLKLKRLADELRRLATTDALTEIANRRTFEGPLTREWKRCLRHRQIDNLQFGDAARTLESLRA